MPFHILRTLDIRNGDEEKLVQEVVNSRLKKMPVQRTVYRGDVPDIRDGESEKHWQKIIDERTEKLRPVSAEGVEEMPIAENEIVPDVIDESIVIDKPADEKQEEMPKVHLSEKFCQTCNGKKAHKVYCIQYKK